MYFSTGRWVIAAIIITQLFCASALFAQGTNATARAQEVLAQSRAALGGDKALNAVQSLSALGDFRSGSEGKETSGELQLDLIFPDKLMRTMKWNATQEMKVTAVQTMNGHQVWTDSHAKDSSQMASTAPMIGGVGHGGGRGGGMSRRGGHGSAGSGSGGGHGGTHTPGPVPSSIDGSDQQQIRYDFSCLIYSMLLHFPDSAQVEIGPETKADIEGVEADYLKITAGKDFVINLAIDKKTHRPVMAAYNAPSANEAGIEELHSAPPETHNTQIQIYFSDFKETSEKKLGDIWLPYQITKTQNGLTVEDMRIKKYQINPHISPKEFEKKQ